MLLAFALALRLGWPTPEARLFAALCPQPPVPSRRAPRPAYLPCQVEHDIAWSATNRRPVYPDEAVAAGLDGLVRVLFVVSARGIVEDTTIKVLRSPHDIFTSAVRNGLLTWRADPARLAGSAVRELVTHDFRFVISDSTDCPRAYFFEPQTTIVCRPPVTKKV